MLTLLTSKKDSVKNYIKYNTFPYQANIILIVAKELC